MKVKLKDPNRRIHGKLHKCDSFYFRVHYGEQHLIYISKPYIDRPTEKQKASRESFKAIRQEVARQLHDPQVRLRWEQRFKADNQGYKMLHTYVYAKLKAGETVTQSPTRRDVISLRLPQRKYRRDATHRDSYAPLIETSALRRLLRGNEHPQDATPPIIILSNGVLIPLFFPYREAKGEQSEERACVCGINTRSQPPNAHRGICLYTPPL